MARVQSEAAQAIYRAADTFVDQALRRDDSLFTPGSPTWALATVTDLHERFVQHPDVSKRKFDEKFRDQLAGAPAQTIQLAGEVLYVYFLIDRTVLGQTKRDLINEVLSWSPQPVAMPTTLAATLDGGIAATGTGFGTRRPSYLAYLIEFAKVWKDLAASDSDTALADPWRFESLVHSINAPGAWGEREALLHLVFPDTFEPIVSLEMKKEIVAGFAKAPGGSENLDRRLAEIRAYLVPQYGETFTFYQDDVAARWRSPETAPAPQQAAEQSATNVWWVNQGESYTREYAGGYLWAPKLGKDGHPRAYWTSMESVAVGDLIVHYAAGIRALSRVTEAAQTADRPGELNGNLWQTDGYLLRTSYRELAERLPLTSLPAEVRQPSEGPFDSTGGVKQGYLFKTPQTMAEGLVAHFRDHWPNGQGGGPVPTRSIYQSICDAGFRFPNWLVTDYLLSLAAKPFVLLSGISGTGKTKLAQLVADYFAHPEQVEETIVETPATPADGFVHVVGLSTLRAGLTIPKSARLLFPELEAGEAREIRVEAPGLSAKNLIRRLGFTVSEREVLQFDWRRETRDWLAGHAQKGDYVVVQVLDSEDLAVSLQVVKATRRVVTRSSARVAFLSVRSDWTDNRSLLGYYNPLTGAYVPTELLRLLLRATAHPHEPHFAILDEMNLAKVEYYFSDFLSAMESCTEMVLHDVGDAVTAELGGEEMTIPERLKVPANLLFTGTVNVDETTFMFSPKVLDRANVIQFHDVDLQGYGDASLDGSSDDGYSLPSDADLAALLRIEPARRGDYLKLHATQRQQLETIHDILAAYHLHFGYRVANEIARYQLLARRFAGEAAAGRAFDLQIQQKILPKFVGNRSKLERPLWELLVYLHSGQRTVAPLTVVELEAVKPDDCPFPVSAAALKRMLLTLRQVGFASFIE